MPKWFWVLLAVVISAGIYFSIRYGLRPKPIPLMKPTHFSSYEEVGVVTFRRMLQPIRSEKILVLGYDSADLDTLLVWQGLLKAARESGLRIQKVYSLGLEQLPPYFSRFSLQNLDLQHLDDTKRELVKLRRRYGLHIFLVPSEMATHLRKDSMTKKLEASALGPVFSLTILPLVLDPEKQEELSSSCTDLDGEDYISRLNCITFKYAKSQWRKKIDSSKMQAAIERYGLKEYLLFLHRPKNHEPAAF